MLEREKKKGKKSDFKPTYYISKKGRTLDKPYGIHKSVVLLGTPFEEHGGNTKIKVL
jgi:hypothetical protein